MEHLQKGRKTKGKSKKSKALPVMNYELRIWLGSFNLQNICVVIDFTYRHVTAALNLEP